MTIKEIAEQCGVSRGTVDRVLNGRGRVKPETERLIRETIDRAGYTKNMAGRALTVRRLSPVIGVVMSGQGNPFFDDVAAGIHRAAEEYRDWGVTLEMCSLSGYRLEDQLEAIRRLSGRVAALILQPINDEAVRSLIHELREGGVPVITLNSDLEGCERAIYVGSDYFRGGRTAGGMLTLCMGGTATVGVVGGSRAILGHTQRLLGFMNGLGSGMQVVDTFFGEDDFNTIYRGVTAQLRQYNQLNALFVAAAGASVACQAVIDAGREGQVSVLGFDRVPGNIRMMKRGIIKALICQQPERQGYEAVRAAWDCVLGQTITADRRLMDNQIRILQNIDEA